MMANQVGISVSSVQLFCRSHGLQPHRVRQFRLSSDPNFIAKLRDVVSLYIYPPSHSILLSFYEKSQIQSLYLTQPFLPIYKFLLDTLSNLTLASHMLRGRHGGRHG